MTAMQKSAQDDLRRLVEQIERLCEEKKGIEDDIKDKFAEAKSSGFDVKILRQVLKLRKKSKTDREEEEAVLHAYMASLGMIADLPLGKWAIDNREMAN